MSRAAQHVVLLLIGLSTVVMLVKGTYLNYVKPGLWPWLVLAAVALVVLGLSGVVHDLRHATEPEHGHVHRRWLTWLLLIPIALCAFVVPPPLDARGANPPPAVVSAPALRPFPPLPAGSAPELSLPDTVMRAAADSAHSLDDRTITLIGFAVHTADGVDLGRVVIVCCAADAQLARVHLAGPAAPSAADYPEDTWLRLRGRIQPGSSRAENNYVPTMIVTDVSRIDRPKNTYAY